MSDLQEVVASTDRHLSARPVRSPAYEAESKALRRLSDEMAHNPNGVLAVLCEQVLNICGAESAGVSILTDEESDVFTWPAIAGMWASFEGATMPRDASPCGMVIRAHRSLLFRDVEKQFPAAAAATPLIGEVLLAPFRVDGKPIGTVWAIDHSNSKRFDREDQRLLESVANFAGAAYAMTRALDATRKAREELGLVNLELAHRLKNMLAVVMAISANTLKSAKPREDVNRFHSRLQALAAAQDILISQAGGETNLETLAKAAIGKLCDGIQLEITGPQLSVGPSAALSLSLILHELVTNALKHGALSTPEGRVTFAWSIAEASEPKFEARWTERGGPSAEPPKRRGFGTRLIAGGIVGRGDTTVTFRPEGLEVEFSAPLHSLMR